MPPAAPTASPTAAARKIAAAIKAADGWIGFDDFLQIALYDPICGYYGGGRVRFDGGGDFVTAPFLSPLFAEVVADFLAPFVVGKTVVEWGGGDGRLARQLLACWGEGARPRQYLLIEESPALRARQQANLRPLWRGFEWPSRPPDAVDGAVLLNEVLDAIPFQLFSLGVDRRWRERGVASDDGGRFVFADAADAADAVVPPASITARLAEIRVEPPYVAEVSPRAEDAARQIARSLRAGIALIFDYGFLRDEFYHPQKTGGSFMCHHRGIAHDNPFVAPGEQDITAHVDFSAIAEAAREGGCETDSYQTLARFLLDGGALEKLQRRIGNADYPAWAGGANKLLGAHEMGEIFKVMTLRPARRGV